eukprot:3132076-Pyramimonas_sp.AAC.1
MAAGGAGRRRLLRLGVGELFLEDLGAIQQRFMLYVFSCAASVSNNGMCVFPYLYNVHTNFHVYGPSLLRSSLPRGDWRWRPLCRRMAPVLVMPSQ